jgi:dienelactone hydrolase
MSARVGQLPGTRPLTAESDLAAEMVAGLDRFLTAETEAAVARRAWRWLRDFASPEAFAAANEPHRRRLRTLIGVVDPRASAGAIERPLRRTRLPVLTRRRTLPSPRPSPHCRWQRAVRVAGNAGLPGPNLELVSTLSESALVAGGSGYRVLAVRWPVLRGVDAEGLLLLPEGAVVADVVALPDCDWSPEQLVGLAPGVPAEAQFARRLAESGCRVLIPTLIDRQDTWSGHPEVRMTNQPHREFIYRAAYELGRHIIGYEVQKVLAAVDWFRRAGRAAGRKIGVAGYGEGGLLALYSAAIDPRIDAALVSGYFRSRQQLWREPIYRNVWGLLEEFGDAELASMVAPRTLIVEACRHPEVSGPPPPREGRSGAAPGEVTTPPRAEVEAECARARTLTARLKPALPLQLVVSGRGKGPPGSEAALSCLLAALGARRGLAALGPAPVDQRGTFDPRARLKRQFDQLVEHTQNLMREAEFRRREYWSRADPSSPGTWRESCRSYRNDLWNEVIGQFFEAGTKPNPRSRLVHDEPKYRGYELVLDLWPDVFAYGILLLPKGLREGERRPVVVCQHGLEGRPQDVADPRVDNPAYHRFACRLAERGFVTFAPQNPYIGQDRFRVLQRKAHPLKKSLYAIITAQHERILDWLCAQPFVDPERIAFYGLSYGGKVAMRIPALLERYCLSICSADYNEWIWKNVSTRAPYSYMFTGEYDMYEFNLGNTFNYAELSWLICPRPFMVERGHHDGVAPDEWVAYEYAKTRRRYVELGLADRTEIEFFDGPHTFHGVGTFEFLHRHLNWPAPEDDGNP